MAASLSAPPRAAKFLATSSSAVSACADVKKATRIAADAAAIEYRRNCTPLACGPSYQHGPQPETLPYRPGGQYCSAKMPVPRQLTWVQVGPCRPEDVRWCVHDRAIRLFVNVSLRKRSGTPT